MNAVDDRRARLSAAGCQWVQMHWIGIARQLREGLLIRDRE